MNFWWKLVSTQRFSRRLRKIDKIWKHYLNIDPKISSKLTPKANQADAKPLRTRWLSHNNRVHFSPNVPAGVVVLRRRSIRRRSVLGWRLFIIRRPALQLIKCNPSRTRISTSTFVSVIHLQFSIDKPIFMKSSAYSTSNTNLSAMWSRKWFELRTKSHPQSGWTLMKGTPPTRPVSHKWEKRPGQSVPIKRESALC